MKLVEQHIIRKNNINYKPIEDLSIKSFIQYCVIYYQTTLLQS